MDTLTKTTMLRERVADLFIRVRRIERALVDGEVGEFTESDLAFELSYIYEGVQKIRALAAALPSAAEMVEEMRRNQTSGSEV